MTQIHDDIQQAILLLQRALEDLLENYPSHTRSAVNITDAVQLLRSAKVGLYEEVIR